MELESVTKTCISTILETNYIPNTIALLYTPTIPRFQTELRVYSLTVKHVHLITLLKMSLVFAYTYAKYLGSGHYK